MPLFEYRCLDCQKKFTFLYGVVAANTEPRCPRCQSEHLKKLVSRVHHLRGDDARLDDLTDAAKLGDLDDPGNLRRLARKIGREVGAETGEDLSAEFEAMMEEDEHGGATPGGDDGTIY